jgi:hypothetical protein
MPVLEVPANREHVTTLALLLPTFHAAAESFIANVFPCRTTVMIRLMFDNHSGERPSSYDRRRMSLSFLLTTLPRSSCLLVSLSGYKPALWPPVSTSSLQLLDVLRSQTSHSFATVQDFRQVLRFFRSSSIFLPHTVIFTFSHDACPHFPLGLPWQPSSHNIRYSDCPAT